MDEAKSILQANLANSQGRLQADTTNLGSDQQRIANMLGIRGAQAGLYGTTPGMASMFGNQTLGAMGNENQFFGNNAAMNAGLVNSGLAGLSSSANIQNQQGTPWWRQALGAAAAGAATYFTGGAAAPFAGAIYGGVSSDRNLKEGITDINSKKAKEGLKKLQLHKWRYKGDDISHIGPMAQDFKKAFGVGDGKTIHLADVMGVMLAAAKEQANA